MNITRPLASAALLTALALPGLACAAPFSPFVYAEVETFHINGAGDDVADGEQAVSSASSPVFAEVTSPVTGAYGKARAQFGSLGFAFGSGSGGVAMWSDGFVVTGGIGHGLGTVSVTIDGTVQGLEADMSYSLFVSAKPFEVQAILKAMNEPGDQSDQSFSLPDATRVLHTEVFDGLGSPNITLTGTLPFEFGQTLYLASVFGGDVCYSTGSNDQDCRGGSEDFFHSATFGISVAGNTTLTALSTTSYAAAVPEPGTWALLCGGLLTMVTAGQARRSFRKSPSARMRALR